MGRARWAESEDEDQAPGGGGCAWAGPGGPGRRKVTQVPRGGGRAWGQVGRVGEVEAEDRKRSRGGPSGARSIDVTSGARPVSGEGRGLRLVQPGGRKEGEER